MVEGREETSAQSLAIMFEPWVFEQPSVCSTFPRSLQCPERSSIRFSPMTRVYPKWGVLARNKEAYTNGRGFHNDC
jgi:hypothetical protein